MSMVILGVGRRKTGKSTQSKVFLDTLLKTDPNRDIIIYDVNAEYKSYYNEPFISFEQFMEKIKDVRDSCIFIEESTIFFDSRSTNKIMTEKLVRARHENNIILLNFHSWSQVPKNILSLTDYVRVFKTSDSLDTVRKKTDIEALLKTFQKITDSENNYDFKLVDLYA